MEPFNLPRPRWTQRSRIDVRKERKNLGFSEGGPVKVVDVNLALRILERQQLWRHYAFEVSLTAGLLVILLVYSLWARNIPNGFFVGRGLEQDLNRGFSVNETSFDLNTPMNTSIPFGSFKNGQSIVQAANLNPLDLQPVPVDATSYFGKCVSGGRESNSTDQDTGICIKTPVVKHFAIARTTSEFQGWLTKVINNAAIFSQNLTSRNRSSSLIPIGAIRIRQLRSQTPFGLVRTTNDEQTSPISCSHLSPFDTEAIQATQYRSPTEMNGFPSPSSPSTTIVSHSPPNLAERLNFYFPSDGFAFDVPRCDSSRVKEQWDRLIAPDCRWINDNFTSAVFVSLTGYDPVSDSMVFARYSFERYPQGTRITSKDIRVFRIPGSASDHAVVWRIVLCAFSLAQLLFFLSRVAYKGYLTGSLASAIDRWFVLDLISLAIIQAAVWLSISNSQNAEVKAVSSPDAMATMANCSYTAHVTLFDNISYDEMIEDFLLGISLVLQGLKFFQICQLSARLSAAYSIINTVGGEILWWFVLTCCFFFFFAFGAYFMFGVFLPQFFTLPTSFASTFLIFSKIPKYSIAFSGETEMFSAQFWADSEGPNLSALIWELAEYAKIFEINVLFGFSFWLGMIIVVIYWLMRNLLLGVVLSGYEIVNREIEAEEMDALERRNLRHIKRRVSRNISILKGLANRLKTLFWRVWNNSKIDELLMVIKMDPVIKRRGFATENEMDSIFRQVGIVESAKVGKPSNDANDSGSVFQADFYASFEFTLDAFDEAILILLQQESPFALSLLAVSEVRRAASLDAAVEVLLERCLVELEKFPTLPFFRHLQSVWSGSPDRKKRYVASVVALARSMESAVDSDTYFDIQLLMRRLGTRLSDSIEELVARYMDKGLAQQSPLPNVFDDAVELAYDACTSELGLYLSAIPDAELVKAMILRELKRAKRVDARSRYTDGVALKLSEIFPCLLVGWQAKPTDAEIERSREMFEEIFNLDRALDSTDSEDVDDDENEYGDVSTIVDTATNMDATGSRGTSLALESGEDNFDPTAQQRWEEAVYSGNFVLTLSVVHMLRSTRLSDQLTRELISLERSQIDLERDLLGARQDLDDRISARKPMTSAMNEIKKHGIEPHPGDHTYHVHFVSNRTGEYKFVGVFNTQEEAEIAMTMTIQMDSTIVPSKSRNNKSSISAKERDADSWEDDDMHYGAMARQQKERKKAERALRHKGDLAGLFADDKQGDVRMSRVEGESENEEEDDTDSGNNARRDEPQDVGDELDPTRGRQDTIAKRLAETGQSIWNRTSMTCASGWYAFESWLNRNNTNRLHYDTTNNVWRDANDDVVKVITKPKTVMPLAGKRWQKLQADQ